MGKKTTPCHVLAFDVETSGHSFIHNGIVSIGASVQDQDSNELLAFQVNLSLPEGCLYDEGCLKEFWLKNPVAHDFVKQDPLSPEKAMEQFCQFLNTAEISCPDLVLVSDNPGFDVAWLDLYLDRYSCRLPLAYTVHRKYRPIADLRSMHYVLLSGKTGPLYSYNDLSDLLGLKSKWPYDHNPLNDARTIADLYNQTIKKMLEND